MIKKRAELMFLEKKKKKIYININLKFLDRKKSFAFLTLPYAGLKSG
jgi:hypothetical protein